MTAELRSWVLNVCEIYGIKDFDPDIELEISHIEHKKSVFGTVAQADHVLIRNALVARILEMRKNKID